VAPIRFSGHFHLHYYPTLPRILREIHPDVVHIDEEPYNLATYLGVRAAASDRIPALFFSWQNILRRYPPPFSLMERAVYRRVVHGLAGSEDGASVLRRKGFARPITVVPQFGVDPDVFSPGARGPDSAFTIGFLNRLTPAKAPMLMLKAFSMLPSDCRLYIVGDGPLRSRLEAEIVRGGFSRRVTLRPRIPSVMMPDLIRKLDVIALPSITTNSWKEQFGRVLIEGMACAVPVVGSDSGEIPNVVGDAGLVVPEGDVVSLAGALRRLYESVNLRQTLGERGRERVLSRYTHARIARLTSEAYQRVCGSAG
jgi:glycosyltransferase involved in cell wall biosynthesis